MNVIETVKNIINTYPKISEFSNGVTINYIENQSNNYGLFSNGDSLLKEDMLGNQTRQHNFVLYAVNQSYTDYERLANSTFLLELGYWLEKQQSQKVTAIIGQKEYEGEILSLSSANGMLFEVPTGNINDGVTYQIQIYAKYIIESED